MQVNHVVEFSHKDIQELLIEKAKGALKDTAGITEPAGHITEPAGNISRTPEFITVFGFCIRFTDGTRHFIPAWGTSGDIALLFSLRVRPLIEKKVAAGVLVSDIHFDDIRTVDGQVELAIPGGRVCIPEEWTNWPKADAPEAGV